MLFQIGKPSLPAFADIFIDAFYHNDQITLGHGVRTGSRIIGGYLEGVFFKQFLIKGQTARFGMEQFYLGSEMIVENEYVPTSDVASHPLCTRPQRVNIPFLMSV